MKVRLRYPLRVALLYALLGGLWIIVSDRLAAALFPNPQLLLQINTYKGWFFITSTTILLYLGLRREYNRVEQMTVTLRESEKRYQLISENSADVIWTLDLASQRFTYVSPSVFNLRGLTPEEVIVEPMQASMTPASFQEVSEKLPVRIAEFMSGDQSARIRTTRVDQTRKDGSIVPTEVVTNLITDANGRVVEVLGITREITERKQAEDALRESEQRLQFVLQGSQLGYWDWDIKTNEVKRNERWAEMLGYHLSDIEFTVKQWTDFIHPDDQAMAQQSVRDHIEGRKPLHRLEYRMRTKDGQYKWILDQAQVVKWDSTRRAIRMSGTHTDITERKRVEEAQQQSEILFRSLFELSPDAVVLLDPHDPNIPSRIVDCNAAACLMNGYQRDELIGHSIDIVNAEPYTQAGQIAYLNRLRDEGTLKYEVFHRHKNGVVFPVEISTSFIKVGERELVIGIDRDITERKQAEEALRESEDKFKYVFENSVVGKSITRFDGGMQVNRAFGDMLGYSLQEMQERNWQVITHPDDVELSQKEIDSLLSGERESVRFEKRFIHKNGHIVWAELSSTIRRDGQERKPLYLMSSVINITERKKAEEILQEYNTRLETEVEQRTRELREAQEQLVRQERLATLGQLAGSIGHELRNPLGVISNAVFFLKMSQPDATEKIKEYLDIIDKETHTSNKIITDLLDFTRTKSIDRQPASVSELIRQTLERYPAPASIDVSLVIPADLPQIYADPQHIIQVLGNLFTNAYQAMDSSAKKISIDSVPNGKELKVSAVVQDAMLKIEVQDRGEGIPPENMKKLFEPLFTTKIKGIGLGLAVSCKLAEANGGSIEVESEVGNGSTFTVYLPIYK